MKDLQKLNTTNTVNLNSYGLVYRNSLPFQSSSPSQKLLTSASVSLVRWWMRRFAPIREALNGVAGVLEGCVA